MPFTYLCARHCLYASRRHERFAFFQRVSCDMQIAKKIRRLSPPARLARRSHLTVRDNPD
jgi:hypothetical protein